MHIYVHLWFIFLKPHTLNPSPFDDDVMLIIFRYVLLSFVSCTYLFFYIIIIITLLLLSLSFYHYCYFINVTIR
jgi:hypothetical protein